MENIGPIIKAARRNRDLTLQEFSDAIGKTPATVSRYERGQIDIPFSVLVKIAEALHTPLLKLLKVKV
jgi:transcriptional regulator with XRE-family HTH domain